MEDSRAKRRADPEAREDEGSIKSPVTRSASATQNQRIELFVIRCRLAVPVESAAFDSDPTIKF